MIWFALIGSALLVGGGIVRVAASKANNDGAWSLYGCIPQMVGALLIIGSAVLEFLS